MRNNNSHDWIDPSQENHKATDQADIVSPNNSSIFNLASEKSIEEKSKEENWNIKESEEIEHKDSPLNSIVSEEVESENNSCQDFQYTSEWLLQNTTIHGWLSFFLFVLFLGGVFSAFYPLITYNSEEYGGSFLFAMSDVSTGFILLAIAIYTVYCFSYRKPDAVYMGYFYIILIFATNLLTLCTNEGNGSEYSQSLRGFIWSIIWFFYLKRSNQVKEIIPVEFRHFSRKNWLIIATSIMIPLLFMVIGIAQINCVVEDREVEERQLLEQALSADERSDGRVVFAIPSGFTCKSEVVRPDETTDQTLEIFTLEDENIGNITICSDYDDDTTISNFDSYWSNWQDESVQQYHMTDVEKGQIDILGNTCVHRIVYYNMNGVDVYWRFYLIFDKLSSKVCVISAYDRDDDTSYIEHILESVRFR